MSKPSILQADRAYTFRSYFELPYESEDILAEFDYSFARKRLSLPKSDRALGKIRELQQRIEETLPLIRLSSEAARRETLIAPVLLDIARYCQCQLRIEYPLQVNNRLKGSLDYLLRSRNQLLVIEAKNDNLTRGFTQLSVELIALSEWDSSLQFLYGAVTIGDIWIFGTLDKEERKIEQDVRSFRVPDDLEILVRTIVGILEKE
ncbi:MULTISPECIES: hypothetical protein [Spirulina sp. CCY15215]|uniref:hypothetical protein n=1 Tax=Spirulina sp. CCY15215 TaxID=2767591 RepID=UPI0019501059|nr:hypothetical protein [Spirulina major]